jgi:GTPase
MADMPGIIEGAHYNRGMGHKFLKHVSRTKVNIYLIDINGFKLNAKYDERSAFETVIFLNKVKFNSNQQIKSFFIFIIIILKELELYDNALIDKPSLLVLNKIDEGEASEKIEKFMNCYENYDGIYS